MEKILLPNRLTVSDGSNPNEKIIIIEPFYYGYGTTVGNSLRRVLLSSLAGAAITAVKINGVSHEFATLDGVKEDALEIILNLKGVRLISHSDSPVKLSLKTSGEKVVTAADFEKSSDIEIVTQQHKIATLTSPKAKFELEVTIEKGRGYSPTEERETPSDIGTIAIDAIFSPIRNVGYKIENTRVGDITNYDKLILTIESDGTVKPETAVKESVNILLEQFNFILENIEGSPSTNSEPEAEQKTE
ncbi:MAG: hypothetical protein ACD_76C00106G0015 [uncultured bacterium]|nr:MAG: hypothetical protein ACD_76C00106G0015 [uncultured bacterium]HBD05584.1 DNA-directed RNA polymerase subunit alpha [Candidatus Uhrbacteria bacterium]